MAQILLGEWAGTSVGPSTGKFHVHLRCYYNDTETTTKFKIYREYSIYGPATKLTSSGGHVSWASSSSYQIGGTSTKATYNGTTYYVSAKATAIAGTFEPGATVTLPYANAYYTASGTKYNSTIDTKTVTVPLLVDTYAVTYNANGGTGAPSAQTKTEGEDLVLSETVPTYDGFVFRYWLGSDGNTYQPGATYSTDADLTLTAQWRTASNIHVKVGGDYKDGNAYIKVNGSYVEGTPYIKINGSYKEGV